MLSFMQHDIATQMREYDNHVQQLLTLLAHSPLHFCVMIYCEACYTSHFGVDLQAGAG